MDIDKNWNMIKRIFEDAKSSWHQTVATVNPDGTPRCAPIGSLILRDDMTAYFFDGFLSKTARNLEVNKKVCVLAVNSDFQYWVNSIKTGIFDPPPSVRLIGTAIGKREATEEELNTWHNAISIFEGTPVYEKLWKDLKMVWDLKFDSFEPTSLTDDVFDNPWK